MNVKYLTSSPALTAALNLLGDVKKICIDFETTGLQPGLAKPRLLQICDASPEIEDRDIFVVDLFKILDTNSLKEFIESRDMVIGHNLNFDMQFLLFMDIDFNNKIFCTYIAEKVLRAGFKEKKVTPKTNSIYFADLSCSLKAVASRRLGLEIDKANQRSDWSLPELDIAQIEYAARDVDILPAIASDQIEELKEENLIEIYSIESRCIRPVAMMCSNGFTVNTDKLKLLKISIDEELAVKSLEFVEDLDSRLPLGNKLPRGEDGSVSVGKNRKTSFNPGSTQQVIAAFQLCGIEVPLDNTTGKYSLSQIALSEFDSNDPTLNLYRQRVKLETQLEHVIKLINNIHPLTHRIHSGYNQVGANSGRFTCNGAPRTPAKETKSVFSVNLQQIPRSKKFRECFVASPGYTLVIADYNQMELRLLAELANIKQMQDAYNNEVDLHTLTAALMNNCTLEQVTKDQRQMAKGANFGMVFGIGFKKFKTYAASSFGLHLSLSEAKVLHAKFHSSYPRLREWHRERGALVQDGWSYTRTALGRRRLLSYEDAKMTTAANTLIQGTGADILKIALGNLNEYLSDSVRLVAVVHDEIVLEVKESLKDYWIKKLPEIMIKAGDSVFHSTKLVAEPGSGPDWSSK